MWTGRVEGKGPHLAPHQRTGWAVALLVAVVAGVVWLAQPATTDRVTPAPITAGEVGAAAAPGRPGTAKLRSKEED